MGSTTAQGGYYPGNTMPMGGLTFASSTPFRSVTLAMPPTASGATDFILDNIAVQVSAAAPQLGILLTTTNTVVISWPAPSPGYVLQENSGLGGTANWPANTNTVEVVGGQNQVTLSSHDGNRFFRLFHP